MSDPEDVPEPGERSEQPADLSALLERWEALFALLQKETEVSVIIRCDRCGSTAPEAEGPMVFGRFQPAQATTLMNQGGSIELCHSCGIELYRWVLSYRKGQP